MDIDLIIISKFSDQNQSQKRTVIMRKTLFVAATAFLANITNIATAIELVDVQQVVKAGKDLHALS